MNKLLILALLSIFAISSNADSTKVKDTNKTMTDDEFMKEFMKLDKQEKDAERKLEATKKLGKTLDEIGDKLGVDKK